MPLNEPRPLTQEAGVLSRAAERDLKAYSLLSEHPDAPPATVCFHAQQYVEKAMKAVLVAYGVSFRPTHDLALLSNLLEQIPVSKPLSLEQIRLLAPFAVTFRYEDTDQLPAEVFSEVHSAIDAVRQWLKQFLTVPGQEK